MKTPIRISLFLAAFFSLSLSSCNHDDIPTPTPVNVIPSPEAFNALHEATLDELTQHFQINAGDSWTTLTSENGVTVDISGPSLTLNGNPVTGTVDVEYIEIFDAGTMAAANKSTMGRKPNGDKAMLLSGGQLYINVTKNGQQLDPHASFWVTIPTALTASEDIGNDMSLWTGIVADTLGGNNNIVWDELDSNANPQGQNFVMMKGNAYMVSFGNFGWTNVDCFYSDPRQKTTLLADVPDGFNPNNCHLYLSYDGKGNGLAQLDTYTAEGYFTEHYGQIPVGLQCHAIFITESNGQYRYAIKPVTIAENGIINFTIAETTVGTAAQLGAAIRAVQN